MRGPDGLEARRQRVYGRACAEQRPLCGLLRRFSRQCLRQSLRKGLRDCYGNADVFRLTALLHFF